MRLIIFTNRDLASNYHLNLLLPHLHAQVIAIFVSDKVGKTNKTVEISVPEALRNLKFFEQTLPNEILFPQLDLQNRNLNCDKLLTFKELSKKYHIPITSLNEVQSSQTLDMIRGLKPDLIISVRYGKIFKEAFIKIPTHGILNLHSGKLPQYRGVLASFRALMNGDVLLQTTLHYIQDGKIDNGGIIGFSNLSVQKEKSLFWHILNLYPISISLLISTIQQIQKGEKPVVSIQSEVDAQYFTFPNQTEIDIFIQKGYRFMDVSEYHDFIRQYL
jgi:methionyl-tRNA formyltransferase